MVVEGHGEVESAPILIRRIANWLGVNCDVARPMRVPRSTLLKPGELERAVTFLGNKVGPDGGVIVLVDGDDDRGCALAPALLARAVAERPDRRIGVVVAEREFESWFLAGAESLRGVRGLSYDIVAPTTVESIRGAKEWLTAHKQRPYLSTGDQPALATKLDLDQARSSYSFDKLIREVARLMGVPAVKATVPEEPDF